MDEAADPDPETALVFDAARARIDGFVRANFGWRGTIGLHRRAFGWDLLRAPFGVMLAPLHVLIRLAAPLLRRLGARGLAAWLDRRQLVLKTAVAREIELRIAAGLIGVAVVPGDRRPIARIIAGAPELRDLLRRAGSPDEADARTRRVAQAIAAYSGTRSAVAEITTALIALVLGAALFRAATPGMVSMAPRLADSWTRDTAIGTFPLGSGLGRMWYGVFPVDTPVGAVVAMVILLILAASALTAFAGVLADPPQAWAGVHRRRLHRLIDSIEADLTGAAPRPFAAREHYYARMADVVDIGSALVRLFR